MYFKCHGKDENEKIEKTGGKWKHRKQCYLQTETESNSIKQDK